MLIVLYYYALVLYISIARDSMKNMVKLNASQEREGGLQEGRTGGFGMGNIVRSLCEARF